MADKNIRVELEPMVKITWPDGTSRVFSTTDLQQFTYTLIIEGLLMLQTDHQNRVLSEMELELVTDDQGRMVLRPSGLTLPSPSL